MKDARETLFEYKEIYNLDKTEDIFIEAIKDSIDYHSSNCEFYNKLFKRSNFCSKNIKTIDDCGDIPVIPAEFFKYHKVLSVEDKDISIHATSSGTQGQKSQMFYDEDSLKAGIKMVTNVMKYYNLISFIPTNYIMLGYEPWDENEMGSAKTAMGITRFAPALKRVFALRNTGKGYEPDIFGVLDNLLKFEKYKLPVRFVGFPSYLYLMLKKMKEAGIKLKLNKHSRILLGGGWKRYDGHVVDKYTLYKMAEEQLGIPTSNCKDFYSAVEHSIAYAECENHHMHVPIWSRVYIRDVKTLKPIGYDKPGFLSFVTPLVKSAPLTSVMMGDLAVMHEGKKCGCGITSPYFEVLGRAGTSKMRSCAIAASEFLGGDSQ